jgi:hypothetical protein
VQLDKPAQQAIPVLLDQLVILDQQAQQVILVMLVKRVLRVRLVRQDPRENGVILAKQV